MEEKDKMTSIALILIELQNLVSEEDTEHLMISVDTNTDYFSVKAIARGGKSKEYYRNSDGKINQIIRTENV